MRSATEADTSTPFVALDLPPKRTRSFAAIAVAVVVAGACTTAAALMMSEADEAAQDFISLAAQLQLAEQLQHHVQIKPPDPKRRCEEVMAVLNKHDKNTAYNVLKDKYSEYVTSQSNFYRGTASLFWKDFVQNGWGIFDLTRLGVDSTIVDNAPLQRTSTWTWITGDQHLSNFGAWRNRHGDIVFGMNDFDEAMIYDFQMDIWRLAVSVYTHALSNGLEEPQAGAAVLTLCDAYLSTLAGYVGNEKALTYELTPETATGALKKFLTKVKDKASHHHQLKKFTEVVDGQRRLLRNDKTSLVNVSAKKEEELRRALSAFEYGATMMKIGWHARLWDASDGGGEFKVLDVARRVGSGMGSYGVGRYYVLLSGVKEDVEEYADGTDVALGVILDVKFEPTPVAASVFNTFDAAWYHKLFPNHAARAVFAQRALTSYTDPFAGWAIINGSSFVVRQRSPWKEGFNLSDLTSYREYTNFVAQVAVVTATSHARGSVGKSPATFKEIVTTALSKASAKATWSMAVTLIAAAYHKQVGLDYECFREYYNATFAR